RTDFWAFRQWLRACMGSFQPCRDRGTICSRPSRSTHRDDGECNRLCGGGYAYCRGPVSVESTEARMPQPLPRAACLPGEALAAGGLGRSGQWCASWSLLFGLLLGADGVAVCWRLDEPTLDRRPRNSGPDRENATLGAVGKPPSWRSTD